MNRLEELYSNTIKIDDVLSPLFILPLTHPHLVNAAYLVCGGQRAATESGGRRWLGDFPVTVSRHLLTVRVVIRLTSIFVHCLSIASLSWPAMARFGRNDLNHECRTGEISDGFGSHSSAKITHFGSGSGTSSEYSVSVALAPVAPALGEQPWIRWDCVRLQRRFPIRRSISAPVPASS